MSISETGRRSHSDVCRIEWSRDMTCAPLSVSWAAVQNFPRVLFCGRRRMHWVTRTSAASMVNLPLPCATTAGLACGSRQPAPFFAAKSRTVDVFGCVPGKNLPYVESILNGDMWRCGWQAVSTRASQGLRPREHRHHRALWNSDKKECAEGFALRAVSTRSHISTSEFSPERLGERGCSRVLHQRKAQ